MQVVGTLSNSDYRRANDYTFADGSSESYVMNADSRRRSLISEISYIHNFSDNTQLSAGYQNTVSRSTNEYLNSDYKPRLTENNNYVYARLGQSIGNVYLSLSTGAKMFWTKNDLNSRHFIRNLSSAQISWNINNKWSLQGAFRYTPSIPSLTALTDYQQQTSPYLASNGNPDLDVAENLNYSISLRYSHKLFNATFYSAYYSTNKCVVNDVAYAGNKLFLQQYVNTDYRRVFENSLSLQSSNFHGFGANLYLCLTHYDTAGDEWKHSLTSFDASLSVWWNKGPSPSLIGENCRANICSDRPLAKTRTVMLFNLPTSPTATGLSASAGCICSTKKARATHRKASRQSILLPPSATSRTTAI